MTNPIFKILLTFWVFAGKLILRALAAEVSYAPLSEKEMLQTYAL